MPLLLIDLLQSFFLLILSRFIRIFIIGSCLDLIFNILCNVGLMTVLYVDSSFRFEFETDAH